MGAITEATAVPLSKLKVPGSSPEECLRLAFTLWDDGYLCTVQPALEELPAAEVVPLPVRKGAGKAQRKQAAAGAVAPAAAVAVGQSKAVPAGGKKAPVAPARPNEGSVGAPGPAALAAAAAVIQAGKKKKASSQAAGANPKKVAKH